MVFTRYSRARSVLVCGVHSLSAAGGRVGSVVARRAIDLKVRGSSPAHGGSRIAG